MCLASIDGLAAQKSMSPGMSFNSVLAIITNIFKTTKR